MRKVLAVLLSAAMILCSTAGNYGSSWQTTVQAETTANSELKVDDLLDMSELEGFAAVKGEGLETTTGGNMGEVVIVENTVELINAIKDDIPRVVVVKGEVVAMLSNSNMDVSSAKNMENNSTIKSAGGWGLSVGSNKTIVGYDENAVIYGGLKINNESNVIVSNLTIHGVWPYKGPSDTMEVAGSHHVWLNHLSIYNSEDGNMDIKTGSDYISVSWCKFYYEDVVCEWDVTEDDTVVYSKGDTADVVSDHGHRLSGLVGSGAGDHDDTDMGRLHVTFHHNWFADKCDQRMPRVMYGRVHVYNNYYTSTGNSYCVGVDSYGAVLIEGNYFKGVKNPHEFSYPEHEHLGASITARDNKYDGTSGTKATGQKNSRYIQPFETTTYDYSLNAVSDIPDIVSSYAGPQSISASKPKEGTTVAGVADPEVEKADTSEALPTIAPANNVANNGAKITYDSSSKTYTYNGQNSDDSNGFYSITNPFAGKDFSETPTYKNGYPVWTKGVTIAYWVKLPTSSGSVQDAAILNFNRENDEEILYLDKVHYDKCNKYSPTDSSYSLGTKEKYLDADGRIYTVLSGYGKNVRYNPNYPLAGYYYATDNGGAYRVYKQGTDPSVASNWTYLDHIGRGYYAEYAYLDNESEEYGKTSKVQYALASGSFSLYGSGCMGYREDNLSSNSIQRNPYLNNYGTTISTHNQNQFYYWVNGSAYTNSSGTKSPIMTDTSSNWHYVVSVITNDDVRTYIDGTELTTDYLNFWGGAFSVNNSAKGFNWGYGMSKLYRTSSPPEDYKGDTLLLDFISDKNTTLMIGGLGAGAAHLSQNVIKTPSGTQVKNLEFYDVPLSASQISATSVTLPSNYTEAPAKEDETQTTKYAVIPDSELDAPITEPETQPSTSPEVSSEPSTTPVPTQTSAPTEESTPDPNKVGFSGTLYIAGDSIAAGVGSGEIVGWGNIISEEYTSGVTVVNKANAGDSAKSFYYDYDGDGDGDGHRYKAIYDNITTNDYVIISFGHNDGPDNRNDAPVGTDTEAKKASDTEGTFQWYLKDKFIEPALAKGALPILMTPVVRCTYDSSTGAFTEKASHLAYGQAMRDLVAEYAEEGITIPLIDAQKYTYDTYSTLSSSQAAAYHATGDTTHYNQTGAEWIVAFISGALLNYNLGINDYIADASATPAPNPTPIPIATPTPVPTSTPIPSPSTSTAPSTEPTPSPSASTAPSTEPTASPITSTEPSTEPTPSPSASTTPSNEPTASPSASTTPSDEPTLSPSASTTPSMEPSASPMVSEEPSHEPTPTDTTAPSPIPGDYLLGDVDQNGEIQLADAQLALKAALKIIILEDIPRKAADVDKNEVVELPDAQLILKRALQIITEFETET